jgi:hypothetical protein
VGGLATGAPTPPWSTALYLPPLAHVSPPR